MHKLTGPLIPPPPLVIVRSARTAACMGQEVLLRYTCAEQFGEWEYFGSPD